MFKNRLTHIVYLGVFVLLFFQVYLSCTRATDGDRLAEIDTKIALVTLENERLRTESLKLSSINVIEDFINAAGMIPATIAELGTIKVASLVTKP